MVMNLTREDHLRPNQFYANIGNNIHKARIKKKITIEKLSQLTGLKIQTIEKYEMGNKNISFEVLLKLSRILNVKLEEVFKD